MDRQLCYIEIESCTFVHLIFVLIYTLILIFFNSWLHDERHPLQMERRAKLSPDSG